MFLEKTTIINWNLIKSTKTSKSLYSSQASKGHLSDHRLLNFYWPMNDCTRICENDRNVFILEVSLLISSSFMIIFMLYYLRFFARINCFEIHDDVINWKKERKKKSQKTHECVWNVVVLFTSSSYYLNFFAIKIAASRSPTNFIPAAMSLQTLTALKSSKLFHCKAVMQQTLKTLRVQYMRLKDPT